MAKIMATLELLQNVYLACDQLIIQAYEDKGPLLSDFPFLAKFRC